MQLRKLSLIFTFFLLLTSCEQSESPPELSHEDQPVSQGQPEGGLFIIGGGSRPDHLMQRMVEISGADSSGYVVVLPMSSIEPDSSFWYINRQLEPLCYQAPLCWMIDSANVPSSERLDSLTKAALIFITGGDQNRFMERIRGTSTAKAIRQAYQDGALIAGTSAGAALMSSQMISGDQMKEEEYSSTYARIETNNALYNEGLALLPNAIVDQHFVARSRYNRLFTALYDFPGYYGLGVDEETAAYLKGDSLEVIGNSQVVVVYPGKEDARVLNSKIGLMNITLDILLPGDKIKLP